MARTVTVSDAWVDRVTTHQVELLDRIDVSASLGGLHARSMVATLTADNLELRDVVLKIGGSAKVKVSANILGAQPSEDINFPPLPTVTLPLSQITQAIRPGKVELDLNVNINDLQSGATAVGVAPILRANLPQILGDLVVQGLTMGEIKLPAGGFDLRGVGVGEVRIQDLDLSGLVVDQVEIARMGAQGGLIVPALTLTGLQLRGAGTQSGEIRNITLSTDVNLSWPSVGQGVFSVTPSVKLDIDLVIGRLRLVNMGMSASFGSLALSDLDLRLDAHGLRISPVEVTGISAAQLSIPPEIRTLGPMGGPGGVPFEDPAAQVERVERVVLRGGVALDAVSLRLRLRDGTTVEASHGGPGGAPVSLDLQPGETISGLSGQHDGTRIVQLSVRTSKGRTLRAGKAQNLQLVGRVQGQTLTLPIDPNGRVVLPGGLGVITVPPGTAAGDRVDKMVQVPPLGVRVLVQLAAEGPRSFSLSGGTIVGLVGRSGTFVDAIGALAR